MPANADDSVPHHTVPGGAVAAAPVDAWPLGRRWWMLQVYWSKHRIAAQARAKHIGTVVRLVPLTLAGNLFSALALSIALWAGHEGRTILAWLAAQTVLSAWTLRGWLKTRHRRPATASPRTVWRLTLHTVLMSSLWAWLPIQYFGSSTPAQQTAMAMIFTGMICGGGFVLAVVAPAAIAHVLILSGAAAITLILTGQTVFLLMAALLVIYAAIMIANVFWIARMATARIASEHEATRQGQTVELLLRDFEDQSADVLWEVDRDGNLVHVTRRLEQLLRLDRAGPPAPSLLAWFDTHATGAAGEPSSLRKALREAKAFRDLVIPVLRDGQFCWWSLTARPLLDEGNRILGWRGVIADCSEAQRDKQRLKLLALTDSLTGLANRVQLRERLQEVIDASAQRPPRHGALLCADLDNFKWVNDSYGHSVGDAVLQSVAERLRTLVGTDSLVARLGGDEFAVVLDDMQNHSDLAELTQRLVEDLHRPCHVGGRRIVTGVSVGVALIPEHGTSIDELLGNADLALYSAKQGGRGRADFFVPSLGERNRRRLTMEAELREAIDRQELTLHWQPQVQISPWRIVGCEVLLRWQHPTLGAVSPSDFITVAETAGLIGEIGAWALAEACKQAARHLPGITVSVNVSTAQLARSGFVDMVRAALFNSGFEAKRLEIEITESMFIGAAPMALLSLHELRQIGVRIALDDFGTGYSSLAYLRRFPFDTLKIDRGFVRELLSQRDARAIVGTVVRLARSLGMNSVAEGVEEPAQLEVLREVGCDLVQGYLVAKPLPIQEFRQLVANWTATPPLEPVALELNTEIQPLNFNETLH